MKTLILLITLLTAGMANAGDLLLGQWSHHLVERTDGEEFNETHPLIGYSEGNWAVAYMKNSYNEDTVLAMYASKYEVNSHIKVYAAIGAATGYYKYQPDYSIGKVTFAPYFGIEFHPKNQKFGIVVTTIPGSVISAGFKIKIN